MNIYQLRLFCSVVENKSFTRTAQDYWLSQPTVSVHIKNLERYFQVRLLKRGRQGIDPTEAGLLVYQSAQRIIEELGNLDLGLHDLKKHLGINRGTIPTITVGASTTPATYLLPPIVLLFQESYPETRLSVTSDYTNQIIQSLNEGKFDFGFVHWEDNDMNTDRNNLSVEFLYKERLIMVASARGREKLAILKKESINPSDLKNIPLVMGPSLSTFSRATYRQLGNLPLNVALEVSPEEAMKKTLRTFVGASLLCESSVRDEIIRGELFPVSIQGLDLQIQFALIRRNCHKLSPIIKEFISFLEGHLKGTFPGPSLPGSLPA